MLRGVDFNDLEWLDEVVVVVDVDVTGDGFLDDFKVTHVQGFVRYGGLEDH